MKKILCTAISVLVVAIAGLALITDTFAGGESFEQRAERVAQATGASGPLLPMKHFQLRVKDLQVGESGYVSWFALSVTVARRAAVNSEADIYREKPDQHYVLLTRTATGVYLDISAIPDDYTRSPIDKFRGDYLEVEGFITK